MVDYTPTWNLPHPAAADSVLPESRDFASLAVTTDAALTTLLGQTFRNRGTVTSSTNLNTLLGIGYYGVLGAAANKPPEQGNGVLIVSEMVAGTTTTMQHWQGVDGTLWVRLNGSTGNWGNWQQINAWQSGGTLTDSENLNTLVKPGVYGILGSGPNRPPGETSGILTVAEMAAGAAATTLQTFYGQLSRALWTRVRSGVTETWSEWAQINSGRERVIPHALTRPLAGSTETTASRSLRIPFSVGARVRRWRLVIRNANYRTNTLYPGNVTLNTFTFGQATRDEDGEITSSFDSAPAILLRNLNAGDLATPWQSGWSARSLEPGVDYMIGLGYQTDGQTVHLGMGGGWYTNGNPMNAELTVDPTAAKVKRLPFDIRIEAVTDHDVPVDLVIGDSIAAGSDATLPVREAPAAIAARDSGRMIRTHAFGGAAFGEWVGVNWGDPDSIKWRDVTDYGRADRVFIALGNNDIHGDMNLTTIKARFAELVALVRGRVATEVVACTVTPRTAWSGTREAVRVAFNDWLRTYPHGITGVVDMARAVEDHQDPSNPRADFVVGDGIHFSTAGSTALGAAITRPVTTERTDRDTGWRILPLVNGWGGVNPVTIRRVGDVVDIRVAFLDASAATDATAFNIPSGFQYASTVRGLLHTQSMALRRTGGTSGYMRIEGYEASDIVNGTFIYTTTEPWPTTLPGTPA